MKVTVVCDRCKKTIEGIHDPGIATGGYYDTSPSSHWRKYADEGENIICDACMWADARYQADYGKAPEPKWP